MIDKLTELGVIKSTYANSITRQKMNTLKDKAVSEGEFKLVGKDLWLSAPDEIPEGAKLLQ